MHHPQNKDVHRSGKLVSIDQQTDQERAIYILERHTNRDLAGLDSVKIVAYKLYLDFRLNKHPYS